ncbi:hypothetical protein IT409_00080 [Candidatus Falkowbacteria bacterium]|nr:hypothetical protein [Candidatus Falkowbacteria bacterium]
MDKRLWLAYLHVAHASAENDIEAGVYEGHLNTLLETISPYELCEFAKSQYEEKDVAEIAHDPNLLACLFTHSYIASEDRVVDDCAILINEVVYRLKQPQHILERDIKTKAWAILRVMHPKQVAEYEHAQRHMIAKTLLTVIERKEREIIPDGAIQLHWIEGFLQTIHSITSP